MGFGTARGPARTTGQPAVGAARGTISNHQLLVPMVCAGSGAGCAVVVLKRSVWLRHGNSRAVLQSEPPQVGLLGASCQQLAEDASVDIRQPALNSVMIEGEAFVVESEQMED